tara:strand:- start:446 stop:601 length:156 start_codon:yes stop_codon:yes gene_type:complete
LGRLEHALSEIKFLYGRRSVSFVLESGEEKEVVFETTNDNQEKKRQKSFAV